MGGWGKERVHHDKGCQILAGGAVVKTLGVGVGI